MRRALGVVVVLSVVTFPLVTVAEDGALESTGNKAVRVALNGGLGINGRFALTDDSALLAGIIVYRSVSTRDFDHVSVNSSGYGSANANSGDTTRSELMVGYRKYWVSSKPRYFVDYTVAAFYEASHYVYKWKDVSPSGTTTYRSSYMNTTTGVRLSLAPGIEYFFNANLSIEGSIGINASYAHGTETERSVDSFGVSRDETNGTDVQLGTFASAVSLNYYW